ncbi:MAG: aminopeptidase P family protein [Actinomycetota bacterium]|nr:aminopeptidase P family protein [Actinomycetota bacterium]
MPDVLIFADTIRSPELRHELPLAVTDPLIYVERDGTRQVFAGSLELPRLAEIPDLDVVPLEEIGFDELVASGLVWHDLDRELVVRACRSAGVAEAVAPRTFPLETADHLRRNGIDVRADGDLFDLRRRAKTAREIEGLRRAQRAAERAMARVRDVLGEEQEATCEGLRGEIQRVFSEEGVVTPDLVIVSHGAQTAVGHEVGHGPIAPGEPIIVDLFPQDPDSGCYADMTRTFCVGEVPDELRRYHAACRRALEVVYPEIRPGVRGADLHALACEVFEADGYPTQRTKEPGEVLDEGFYHSLGHGVGLEVHELPLLGQNGDALVPGDVLAIEPGAYRKAFGGCRLEDLVLVTEDGCEVLTDFSYELEP